MFFNRWSGLFPSRTKTLALMFCLNLKKFLIIRFLIKNIKFFIKITLHKNFKKIQPT